MNMSLIMLPWRKDLPVLSEGHPLYCHPLDHWGYWTIQQEPPHFLLDSAGKVAQGSLETSELVPGGGLCLKPDKPSVASSGSLCSLR